jgi:hypothetical protein
MDVLVNEKCGRDEEKNGSQQIIKRLNCCFYISFSTKKYIFLFCIQIMRLGWMEGRIIYVFENCTSFTANRTFYVVADIIIVVAPFVSNLCFCVYGAFEMDKGIFKL